MLKRLLPFALVATALMVGAVAAFASSQAVVNRCSYTTLRYEHKVAVYPLHVTCAYAKKILVESEAPGIKTIQFTGDGALTDDADVVRIKGQYWVCGGRFGSYFCGYPYRPRDVRGPYGGTTFKGPFTKDIGFNACADSTELCSKSDVVYSPAP